MAIYLGNLTIKQMEDYLGLVLPKEDSERLEEMRFDNANNIPTDKIHIFDIPFSITCGSRESAQEVFNILSPYGSSMVRAIQINVEVGQTGELKPCPFCGAEVEIKPEGDYWEIRCNGCKLSMWNESYDVLEYMWRNRKEE